MTKTEGAWKSSIHKPQSLVKNTHYSLRDRGSPIWEGGELGSPVRVKILGRSWTGGARVSNPFFLSDHLMLHCYNYSLSPCWRGPQAACPLAPQPCTSSPSFTLFVASPVCLHQQSNWSLDPFPGVRERRELDVEHRFVIAADLTSTQAQSRLKIVNLNFRIRIRRGFIDW